jgi:hypothetical protein
MCILLLRIKVHNRSKSLRNLALVSSFTLLLAACQSSADKSQVVATLGPAPANYKSIAAGYLPTYFKDPRSVIDSSISTPALRQDPIGTDTFWAICFRGNAKNSYGAYTGLEDTILFTKNGVVKLAITVTAHPSNCPGATYTPWKF